MLFPPPAAGTGSGSQRTLYDERLFLAVAKPWSGYSWSSENTELGSVSHSAERPFPFQNNKACESQEWNWTIYSVLDNRFRGRASAEPKVDECMRRPMVNPRKGFVPGLDGTLNILLHAFNLLTSH